MAEALPLMNAGGGVNIAQLIQQLMPIFGGTGQTTTGTTGQTTTGGTSTQTGGLAIDPAINQLLTNLFGQIQAGNSGYTKEAAIADSASIIDGLVRQTIESNMPSVLSGGRAAGIYNDTTRTMLNNDLQARTAGQAAQAVNDLITKYATITQGNNQTAAQVGTALAQGNRTQTQETTNTQTQQQQQQQQSQTAPLVGRGAGSNALIGAGLTAGGTLLKNLPWDKLFGGGSGGFDLGGVFSGIGDVVNPGNILNAGYGMASGFDTGSLSDFGTALSGVTANAGYDFANILPDAAEHVTNFSGLGSDLTGVFAGGGSDLATGIGSSLGDGGGLLSGIGSALSSGWDWLSEGIGGFGDWLGGLFMANGGQVPLQGKIMNFANGGQVPQKKDFANGGNTKRGRPGRAAYDENAMNGRIYDISRALWEQIQQKGGIAPTTGVGGIEAPMVGEGAGGSPAPSYVAAGDPRLRAVIDRVREQIQGSMAAAQPTDAQQAAQLAGRARSITNVSDKLQAAFGGASPAAALAGAELGGASSALAGSPIQIATQLAENGAAAGGIGGGSGIAAGGGTDAAISAGLGAAGGGASALAGSLGTVDALGSMLGTGAFLPSYSAAAGAAGTSATAGGAGIFGGGAGAGTAGAGAAGGGVGGAAPGVAGSLSALPVAAAAALVFDGIMKAFASKDDDLRTAWMKAAIDPKVTFANQGTLAFGAGAMPVPTFFRKYYKDVDWGNQESINQAYQAASEAIMGDALMQPYTDPTNQGFSGGTSAWNDTSAENLAQAQAFASYLNDYLVDNPEAAQTAFQSPIVLPDAPTDENPMPTTNSSGQEVSWQFQRNPETGAFVGGDLAQLEYDRQNGYGGRFLANGGMPARGGELPDQKGDPQGKADNIQINVSGGEYVMPKDVVDILGPEFFDNLVAKFHVPFPDRPPTK